MIHFKVAIEETALCPMFSRSLRLSITESTQSHSTGLIDMARSAIIYSTEDLVHADISAVDLERRDQFPRVLIQNAAERWAVIDNVGTKLRLMDTTGAERSKIVSVDLAAPKDDSNQGFPGTYLHSFLRKGFRFWLIKPSFDVRSQSIAEIFVRRRKVEPFGIKVATAPPNGFGVFGARTRAVRNCTLRTNGIRTYAASRSLAGRRSDRNPFGI